MRLKSNSDTMVATRKATMKGYNKTVWFSTRAFTNIIALHNLIDKYQVTYNSDYFVKLLPLPQPPLRARTDERTNPSAQEATQLRSVLARVYAVSRQNQITTTVP
jgi:hypothetical protein